MSLSIIYFFRLGLAILLLPFALDEAQASGFGVSPSSLEFAMQKGQDASRQLVIYNTGRESAEFAAQSSNKGLVKVSPETGFIEAEGSAVVKVTAAGHKTGRANGEVIISLGNHGAIDKVSLELGTAVPVRLTVFKKAGSAASAFIGTLLSAAIVFAGLAAYYFAKKKPSRFAADFQSAYDLYHLQK